MQFVQLGEYLSISRITGPTHNMLQIRLGTRRDLPPVCERLRAAGGCTHQDLDEAALIRYVLEGVAEANEQLGTSYVVTHIRYVEDDTPPEAVYRFLATQIVERLHNGGGFVPGTGAA